MLVKLASFSVQILIVHSSPSQLMNISSFSLIRPKTQSSFTFFFSHILFPSHQIISQILLLHNLYHFSSATILAKPFKPVSLLLFSFSYKPFSVQQPVWLFKHVRQIKPSLPSKSSNVSHFTQNQSQESHSGLQYLITIVPSISSLISSSMIPILSHQFTYIISFMCLQFSRLCPTHNALH